MEFLSNGITLKIAPGTFPLSTDSMALAHFARLPRGAQVLDLGSGCGTLGLLLCAANADCHVTGLELDSAAHDAALENIRRNGLSHRMDSICADIRHLSQHVEPGSFSVCISNPPYFSGGPASQTLPDARKETSCSLPELLRAAGWALKYGGDCYLVHRPERLAQIIALSSQNGMEAKRLLLLRHRASGPISLILLQLRKGGRPGLRMEEAALFDPDGQPTQYYRDVYHLT